MKTRAPTQSERGYELFESVFWVSWIIWIVLDFHKSFLLQEENHFVVDILHPPDHHVRLLRDRRLLLLLGRLSAEHRRPNLGGSGVRLRATVRIYGRRADENLHLHGRGRRGCKCYGGSYELTESCAIIPQLPWILQFFPLSFPQSAKGKICENLTRNKRWNQCHAIQQKYNKYATGTFESQKFL